MNMGCGMCSILIHNLPYQFNGLVAISTVVFLLNVVLFVIFLLMYGHSFALPRSTLILTVECRTIARYVIWPNVWGLLLSHPVQSMYIGTFPMGLSTIMSMVVFVCVPAFPGNIGYISASPRSS
jgi:tellurite resistance protein TehA-like permease